MSFIYIYSTFAVFHNFILVQFQLIQCHYIACCTSFTFICVNNDHAQVLLNTNLIPQNSPQKPDC
jgi:hypothetical protein